MILIPLRHYLLTPQYYPMNSGYKYTYSLIFSLFILAVAEKSFSQQVPVSDSIQSKGADTVSKATTEKIGRIGIYVDYLNFIGQLIGDNKKYEGGVHLTVYRKFLLAAEGGIITLQPKSAIRNGEYRAEGKIWKVGADFAINYNKEKDSKIYLGFRYANSSFIDEGYYEVASVLWPTLKKSFSRNNLDAQWYEVLFGTEGHIFNGFYTGWTIRYRIRADQPDLFAIPVYSIPGFGNANTKTALAFSMYLKYQITW